MRHSVCIRIYRKCRTVSSTELRKLIDSCHEILIYMPDDDLRHGTFNTCSVMEPWLLLVCAAFELHIHLSRPDYFSFMPNISSTILCILHSHFRVTKKTFHCMNTFLLSTINLIAVNKTSCENSLPILPFCF
jgi:hypothetical protein